jgi:hypothetical protein
MPGAAAPSWSCSSSQTACPRPEEDHSPPLVSRRRERTAVSTPGLAQKVVLLDEALAGARIAHAFGGALALAYYGEPRTTVDIDVNVFVSSERFEEVREVLAGAGVDRFPDAETIRRDGQGRAFWGPNPVDLFFAYGAIHEAMRRDTRLVPFGDRDIPVLSVEHLVVSKVVFDRKKDWIDLEQVLTANPGLDVAEVDRWLHHIVGPQDRRAARFGALVGRFLGTEP